MAKTLYSTCVLSDIPCILQRLEGWIRRRLRKTLTEISKALDLNVSTARRVLLSLKKYGFIDQGGVTRKYKLGMRLMELGNIVASQIVLKT